jgi:hypothetical protein
VNTTGLSIFGAGIEISNPGQKRDPERFTENNIGELGVTTRGMIRM